MPYFKIPDDLPRGQRVDNNPLSGFDSEKLKYRAPIAFPAEPQEPNRWLTALLVIGFFSLVGLWLVLTAGHAVGVINPDTPTPLPPTAAPTSTPTPHPTATPVPFPVVVANTGKDGVCVRTSPQRVPGQLTKPGTGNCKEGYFDGEPLLARFKQYANGENWLWVKTKTGFEGWVPEMYVKAAR